jgi:hypothetical protein
VRTAFIAVNVVGGSEVAAATDTAQLTIVNVSEAGCDLRPFDPVATNVAVWVPSFSLLCDTVPLKGTAFLPGLPETGSVPSVTLRWQDGALRFWLVCLTHLPFTVRPRTERAKVTVTRAATLSVNEKIVPTGRFFVVDGVSAQMRFDCETRESLGEGGGGDAFAVVKVASDPNVVPARLDATRR